MYLSDERIAQLLTIPGDGFANFAAWAGEVRAMAAEIQQCRATKNNPPRDEK